MKNKSIPPNKSYQLQTNRLKNFNSFLKVKTPYLANLKGEGIKRKSKKKSR